MNPHLRQQISHALWAAIEAGTFPAPTRSAQGLVWRSADVLRWKQSHHQ